MAGSSSIVHVKGDYHIEGLGLDPALRHGVLIQASFHVSPSRGFTRLFRTRTLFQWKKRDAISLGPDDRVEDVDRLVNAIVPHVIPGLAVGIDWDATTGSWANNNVRQVAQTATLVAICRRAFQTVGCPVVYLTPAEVRGCFGLRANAKKADVWEAFGTRVDIPFTFRKLFTDTNNDHADAIVLAYLAALADYQSNQGEQSNESRTQYVGPSGISRR